MTELEHRYAKISLLKVGIAIIGFFLLMSVAVTRCLFNEKGIMNIVTTTTYLLKEQQYYNQIICVSAKDAGCKFGQWLHTSSGVGRIRSFTFPS